MRSAWGSDALQNYVRRAGAGDTGNSRQLRGARPSGVSTSTSKSVKSLHGLKPIFDGFTRGETWNGWARPYFTCGQAQRILEAHRSQGMKAWYDKTQGAFAFEFSKDEVDAFPA